METMGKYGVRRDGGGRGGMETEGRWKETKGCETKTKEEIGRRR